MAEKITLKGRKVIGGVAVGEALVSTWPTMGFRNLDAKRGIITERGHPLQGVPLSGKVFVFPTPRGSGDWASFGRIKGILAMVYFKGNALTVRAAMRLNKPTVCDFEQDPTKIIESGDWVRVDANNGIVEITKKATR